MRGLRMEAGQRGAARYGLPGAAVDAPPGRSDCVAAGALHAAQPAGAARAARSRADRYNAPRRAVEPAGPVGLSASPAQRGDRKSTRLNSSHLVISYAVFCLKKKKNKD